MFGWFYENTTHLSLMLFQADRFPGWYEESKQNSYKMRVWEHKKLSDRWSHEQREPPVWVDRWDWTETGSVLLQMMRVMKPLMQHTELIRLESKLRGARLLSERSALTINDMFQYVNQIICYHFPTRSQRKHRAQCFAFRVIWPVLCCQERIYLYQWFKPIIRHVVIWRSFTSSTLTELLSLHLMFYSELCWGMSGCSYLIFHCLHQPKLSSVLCHQLGESVVRKVLKAESSAPHGHEAGRGYWEYLSSLMSKTPRKLLLNENLTPKPESTSPLFEDHGLTFWGAGP